MSGRTIWTYWDRGFDAAPDMVRICLQSWRHHNPGWAVEALDHRALCERTGLRHIIDCGRDDLTPQKISAIGRLGLLRNFGGVWVDATTYCARPLDEWLPPNMAGGFFAFRNPGVDRMMSNWFIAAERDNLLLARLHETFIRLWERNYFRNQNNRFGAFAILKLSNVLNQNPQRTAIWPVLVPVLGAYPYLIFHYVFNRLILTDPGCAAVWAACPELEARPAYDVDVPAKVRKSVDHSIRKAVSAVEKPSNPVFKLDWRLDPAEPYWSHMLPYLASRVASSV